MPSPHPQSRTRYRATTPPPQHPKKRSRNEAGNDDVGVRITKPQGGLSAKTPPNTILTPSDRPTKKAKLSPDCQTDTLSVASPSWMSRTMPLYQRSCHMSATQQNIFQHLPPSRLLAPPSSVGNNRAWIEAAKDDGWESYGLAGPMLKRPRSGTGLQIFR